MGPGRAASSACSTSSSVTCRPSRSDSQPSQVSAATGSDQGKPPRSRPARPAHDARVRRADRVRVGDRDREREHAHLLDPRRAGHLAVAVDRPPPRRRGPSRVRAAVRMDRRDARPHRPLADHQRPVTPHQRAVSDLHGADVGDRVARAGRATERHAEAAGAEASGRRLAVGVVRHDAAPLQVWREPTGGRRPAGPLAILGRQDAYPHAGSSLPASDLCGDETSAIPAADAPEGEPGDPERQAGKGDTNGVGAPGHAARPPADAGLHGGGHEEEEAPLAAGAPVDARHPPAAGGDRRGRAVPVPQGRRRDHHEHERPEHPEGAGGATWRRRRRCCPVRRASPS